MTVEFSPTLATTLSTAGTKQGWSNAVVAALGSTRTLIGIRNGTEFMRVAMTGAMVIEAGNITGFGVAGATTTRIAVDLSSGDSVLRLEGGGAWIQASLGLTQAAQVAAGISPPVAYDFTMSGNPTATSGIGFLAGCSIRAPDSLASGVGPAAPLKSPSSPHRHDYFDMADPANPILIGSRTFAVKKSDLVLQDAERAQDIGDIGIYQYDSTLIWGNYEFGATLGLSAASNTEVGNVPLAEVLIHQAYRWSGYPEETNYDFKSMILAPPPFIVKQYDQVGALQTTYQMHDGKAINDTSLHDGGSGSNRSWDATNALRPKYWVPQMLAWRNTRPRASNILNKVLPGLLNYRPTMSKGQSSWNGVEPLIAGGYGGANLNGIGSFWYAPKWPLPFAPMTVDDPFLDNFMNASGSSAKYNGWAFGYGYEPGASGVHNGYTAPGGNRPDRGFVPVIASLFADNPTGSRAQGNVPYREMMEEYSLCCFNMPHHFVSSALTGAAAPNAEYLNNGWMYTFTYYWNGFRQGKTIRLNTATRDGTTTANYDNNGNYAMNGWGPDDQHDHKHHGVCALLLNSAISIIGTKFDTIASIMVHHAPDRAYRDSYMVRDMAWEWRQMALQWKVASDGQWGFTQAEMEDRFIKTCTAINRDVIVPVFEQNEQSAYALGLRNLGIALAPGYFYQNGNCFVTQGGRLGIGYLGGALQIMKQTGFWSRMYGKGGVVKKVLDNLMRNCDKYCFDSILDTKGYAQDGYVRFGMGDGSNINTIPASWAAQQAAYASLPESVNDFIHVSQDPGGVGVYQPSTDASMHMFEAYAYVRKGFFPEFPNDRLDAAIAKFKAYDDFVVAQVNAATTNDAKRNADKQYAAPNLWNSKPPASGMLGPA